MNPRRRTICLAPLLISTLLPAAVCAASLAEVRSVYLLPMSNGLDQYLANSLTRNHVVKVVTDPKAADAVLTDSLGVAFEERLLKLRPDLKPPAPAPKKDDADKDKDKPRQDEAYVPPTGTFHSSKGTVFLVDARSQQVVWSTYQPSGRNAPKDVERTAVRISKKLAKDMTPAPAAAAPPANAHAPAPAPAPAPAAAPAPAPATAPAAAPAPAAPAPAKK